MAIGSVVAIKGTAPTYYEKNAGAHYYAYSPISTTYTEAFATIVLPTSLHNVPNTGSPTNYNRNAYISLGIKGNRGIDLGLKKSVDCNWHPFCFDTKQKSDGYSDSFKDYTGYAAPSTATKASIVVKPVDRTHVAIYVQFQNAKGVNVGITFDRHIKIAANNLSLDSGKILCGFYRFASLIPNPATTAEIDNQMDSTYMLGGKFIGLDLYNRNICTYSPWGINTGLIEKAWKVSPERITLTHTVNSDTFQIDHWFG